MPLANPAIWLRHGKLLDGSSNDGYLLPHDRVDFNDVVVEAVIVEHCPHFAAKGTSLELEESQIDPGVHVRVDNPPGWLEGRR